MISSTTINSRFRQTGILPTQWDCPERPSTSANDDPTPALSRNMFDKIAKEFNSCPNSVMTEDEFGTCDNHVECSTVLTEEEILELVNEVEDAADDIDDGALQSNKSLQHLNKLSRPWTWSLTFLKLVNLLSMMT